MMSHGIGACRVEIWQIWHVKFSLDLHCGLLVECGLSTTGFSAVISPMILPWRPSGLNRADDNRRVCSGFKPIHVPTLQNTSRPYEFSPLLVDPPTFSTRYTVPSGTSNIKGGSWFDAQWDNHKRRHLWWEGADPGLHLAYSAQDHIKMRSDTITLD